jgi:segregation and condensation protein A
MSSTEAATGQAGRFTVHLEVFEGPFDLLLSLIAKHRLDVTLVALSQVTDEFIAHIRSMGEDWDLGQATEFLVVAATLLDLKVARLLPSAEADEEDLALLEARDLLFARLLQYRAFREVADWLGAQLASQSRRFARSVSLEPGYAALLPEVVIGKSPLDFADLASRALRPKPVPVVPLDHLHTVRVSVQEQAVLLARRLRRLGSATFRTLRADCASTVEVVARFLALLELYREHSVTFEQLVPFGDLQVRWIGGDSSSAEAGSWGGDDYEAPAPETDGQVAERAEAP